MIARSAPFRMALLSGLTLAGLATGALAQDAAPATPPAAEAQAGTEGGTQGGTQAPVALPRLLQDAGLTDVTTRRGPRDGSRIQGKLPDGTVIDAMLDRDGQLRGVKAQGDAALPPALVGALVPQAVRDNAVFAELGSLRAVFTGERGVMLAGADADQNRVHAAFAQDGTLLRFGRGDDDRRDRKDHKDRKGDHGKKHHGDRDHGGRDQGDRDGPRGKDREGRGPGRDAPPPAPQGAAPEAAPDTAPERQGAAVPQEALRQALTAAGYSDLGAITREGPRVLAEADNPQGEPVLVELNPRLQVVRETAR